MKREILTGIVGLVAAVLTVGAQPGNSPIILSNFDVDCVPYIEQAKSIDLGFDTASYLPEDFDPYSHPEHFMDVSYIEEEQEVVLGFDTKDYLPEDFNPYKEYFDLDSIEYIEEEEAIEFDFDTREYLPADFTPATTL